MARRQTPAFKGGALPTAGLAIPPAASWRDPSKGAVAPARVPGRVILWAPESAHTIVAQHEKAPQVVSEEAGSGAWADVPRPRMDPLSSYVGPQALKVQLTLRIDGWLDQQPVADTIAALRAMGRPLSGPGAPDRPPWLRVIGVMPALPPGSVDRWRIDDLSIEEGRERIGGVVARATATVTVARFAPSDIRTTRMPTARTAAKRQTKPWLKGDTLKRFAKRHLGSSDTTACKAIRDANPKVKSWTRVEVGTKLVIPRISPRLELGTKRVGGALRG